MSVAKSAGKLLAKPLLRSQTPAFATNFVREAFERAIDGFGPLKGAVAYADAKLERHDGDAAKAIRDLVDTHVRLAGVSGFVTNLGGIATTAVALPANLAGVAVLQCHLIAGIAHLRGYDVIDPRVRNAVLACMLGEDTVAELVKKRKLPTSPMAIATAPAYDESLNQKIASELTIELLTRATGKRTLGVIGRRTPILGGGFGAVTDGYATYQIGKYAARELRRRP